ncbi:UNVERIFIED_CONTAM: hypothetical protein GTU68_050946, partial [Idotea baltica]|nr:hypothetical protein [Idotea baltica]
LAWSSLVVKALARALNVSASLSSVWPNDQVPPTCFPRCGRCRPLSSGSQAKAIMDRAICQATRDHQTHVVAPGRQTMAGSGFVLDGYPRTTAQAEFLVDALGEAGLDAVIDLDVPLEEVTARMKARGRDDDTDEGIARRLELYEQETRPVLDWFAARGLLVTVDGFADEVEVTDRVLGAVRAAVAN